MGATRSCLYKRPMEDWTRGSDLPDGKCNEDTFKSILFAILSKGRERKLQAICKAGIITSAIGIFLSFLITGAAFYLVFSNPDYRQQLNDMSQQMYGETFDDMLKERGLDL